MKKGDKLEVRIVDMGANGEGVAKVQGIPVFVPFAISGETVQIILTYCKKDYAFADLINVLSPSIDRVNPRCAHFGECGGCDLQHVSYQKQLEIKRASVANNLSKIAKIDHDVESVVCKKQWQYRNKLSLPFGLKDGKIAVGFFKKNTHTIVPMKECPLHEQWAMDLVECLTLWANQAKIRVYDEKQQSGFLRHAVARMLDTLSLTIVGNGNFLPAIDLLVEKLKTKFSNFELYFSPNTKNTNVILGQTAKLIYGTPQKQTLGRLKAVISPLSFLQVNNEIRDEIYEHVCSTIEQNAKQYAVQRNNAKSENNDNFSRVEIIELYSGVGILTAEIALRLPYAKITAVEIVPEATADANKLMAENNLSDRVTNVCADAVQALQSLLDEKQTQGIVDKNSFQNKDPEKTENGISANSEHSNKSSAFGKTSGIQIVNHLVNTTSLCRDDEGQVKQDFNKANNTTVIVDPPRKGCDALVLDAILKFAPRHIIYISCNSATLARDLKVLAQNYVPTTITPFDMFPQTKHVETVVLMSRL